MGCTYIGLSCHFHTDIAGSSAKDRTQYKSAGYQPMTMRIGTRHYSKENGHNNHKVSKYFPFSFQESHSAFSNVFADLLHAIVAGILFGDPIKFNKGVKQSDNP